jgi:hypothetical protein
MITRRQRIILDLLTEAHRLKFHPSPAHLSRLLEERSGHKIGTSPKVVRAELARLLEDGAIHAVDRAGGSAANRYRVEGCPCQGCGFRL